MGSGAARAQANVALAKYWGKRNEALNLPYTGSISITLAGLETFAQVDFDASLQSDSLELNGVAAKQDEARKLSSFLDLIRRQSGVSRRARVELRSNFPVAAGLASSASTFAAFAAAATRAAGMCLTDQELSALARRGSGSAARSVFGGFVEWLAGEADDGTDSYATQLAPPEHWDLGIVVAVTAAEPKAVGSREGMARTAKESPFFPVWLQVHDADLEAVRAAIRVRDLALLGQAAERNCLAMHAVALTARPPLLYWNPGTIAVMQRVWSLREQGVEAYFSIDAGPQVKILCPMEQRDAVADGIRGVAGVQRVLLSQPGSGVQHVEVG